MLAEPVTLSTATLLSLIHRRGGQPHQVLSAGPAWHDAGAKRTADERANHELGRAGLLGARGVEPGLIATVEAMTRPDREFYAWINGGYQDQVVNYTVLAGALGKEAFVLVRDTGTNVVALASARPAALLHEFVGQLPRLIPARGPAVSAPKSLVMGTEGKADPAELKVLSRNETGEPDPAAGVRRVLGLRRLGGGSLYAAVRDRSGSRLRVPRPVNYLDTAEGRWLTEELPGSGEPLISCVPAAPALLADRLRAATPAPAS